VRRLNRGKGFFVGWYDKIRALTPAYPVYTLVLEGGEPAVKAVLSHPVFAGRQRAPSKNKQALLAVYLSAKPTTGEQRKLCSDWACILEWAADENVAVAEFAEWASRVKLKAAKAYVREKRRAARAMAKAANGHDPENQPNLDPDPGEASPSKVTGTERQLEVKLGDGSGSIAIDVPESALQAVVSILQQGEPTQSSTDVLRALARAIEGAEPASALSKAA